MEILRIDGYIGQDDGMSAMFGVPGYFSLKKLNEFIDNLPEGTTEIKIELNSGGGYVNEGFAIHDKLASSGLTVHTEVLGMCGSIATIIALSAKKENRAMHENSEYFIHNPFWQPMSPEALEASDLQRLAEDLKNSEERILDFYVSKTGQKRSQIKEFMDSATGFSAKEAKRLGFVSNIITEAANERKYRIAAFVPQHQKNNEMKDFTPEQKSTLGKLFAKIEERFNKAFTPVFKAMTVDLENGTKMFIESEDGEFVGKKAFKADEAGNSTNEPAADGEYTLTDGRVLVVMAGAVTEVKEKTADETENLKKQVAELQSKLDESTKKAEQEAAAKAELEKNVVAMRKEFADFKNQVMATEVPPAGQQFKGIEGAEKLKPIEQQWLELKMAKKAAEEAKSKK